MIQVTRLDASEFVINAELIETVEATPDTGPIKAMFPPWLVLYLLVYVPVMFGLKGALKVA